MTPAAGIHRRAGSPLPGCGGSPPWPSFTPVRIGSRTERHTYTEWDPILNHRARYHPRLNPFLWPENAGCRRDYSPDMCARSLGVLRRTVMITNRVDWTEPEVAAVVQRIAAAAAEVVPASVG